MYTTPTKENSYTRPRNNLGVRNSGSDWRTRPVSPSNNNNGGTEYNGIIKRSVSPIPDSLSSGSEAGSTRQAGKYGRRPLPTTSGSGAGQSVAALQQHHQWLMQQQEAAASTSRNGVTSNYRSVSPIPNNTKSARSMENNNMKPFKPQHQFSATPMTSNNDDEDVVYDNVEDEGEGDDVEEERMVVIQDVRARSPSTNRSKLYFSIVIHCFSYIFDCFTGSSGSMISVQPAPSFYHTSPSGPQEFKVR
jgi:hypothetical protein